MALPGLTLRSLDAADDRAWADTFLTTNLGGRLQARRSELVDVLEGDGLVAELGQRDVAALPGDGAIRPVALITWHLEPAAASAEIRSVAVDGAVRGRGIGRTLFDGAHEALAAAGVRSAWLVTTNDNVPAIRLYQSLGYVVVEIRRGAIDEIRRTIKPSIPVVGHGGIGMHDELELRRSIPAFKESETGGIPR